MYLTGPWRPHHERRRRVIWRSYARYAACCG